LLNVVQIDYYLGDNLRTGSLFIEAFDNITEDSPMPALRRLITALLLLFCLVPLGKPLGMVLCFGADGHIAFEPVHTQVQSAASLAVQALPYQHVAATGVGVTHENPCTDVSFFASEASAQLIQASDACPKPETPVFLPALLVVPTSTEIPAPSLLPEHFLSSNHPLTILRSVVLHI
jgi:hypothetical protein